MTFRILTVCTGNICRSPLAESLLRRELAGIDGVVVSSAGVGALVGHGMPEPALDLARRQGVTDSDAHRARQLTADHIAEADLVLAMAREHRRGVVELVPAATRKTFTIRELAHIVPEIAAADLADATRTATSIGDALRAAVTVAAQSRGMVAPVADQEELDVIDPYRRSAATYERSAAELVPAVASVSAFLNRAVTRGDSSA